MEPLRPGPEPAVEAPLPAGAAAPPGAVLADAPDDGERRLSPRVLFIWRLPSLMIGVILLLMAALVGFASDTFFVALPLVVVAALALAWGTIGQGVRYRSWSYRVGSDQLDIRRGILVRREATIPYFRVQHIDLHRGPLERLRNVAVLQISTASAATDATLPGIDPADADRLRTFILARAGLEDGV